MEEQLKELGLSEYEIKVYLALLKGGTLTGGAVSKFSGVPHGRTYEVLLKLADKGFVSITPFKPKLFKAVNPEISVKYTIQRKIEELNRLEKEILQNLKNIEKTPEKTTTEKITVLSGRKNVLPVIHHFYKTADKYLKVMFTYEFLPLSTIKLQKEAIDRGVKIRHIATKITDEGLKRMKESIKRGVEVRYYPAEELRLLIRDGKESAQQIVNAENLTDRTTIVIENKELTKALEGYFDSIWKKAKEIE